ncbi:MAG: 1-hydroxycarotenoid 3,4-desaturase CrtD [Pseudomonadota bacterium]
MIQGKGTGPGGGRVVVIGAGMGGLAAAIRLAASDVPVTVIDMAAGPGGKMRTLPSEAGPVDAGPTVLTLRATFDALFALAGQRLDDHLTLLPQPVLARHWWPDGSTLDLVPDRAANATAISAFAGQDEARAFLRFDALAQALYSAFETPVMQAARPDAGAIARAALRDPRLWPALLPGMTLTRLLRRHFRDPRLIQLFGRYATYVGGRPDHSPAVLALIWRAEAAGVWAVQGGMHRLALALEQVARSQGVVFQYDTPAARILRQGGHVTGVQTADGRTHPCDAVVFNGDPAALTSGLMGDAAQAAVPATSATPRSLSAWVWAFAATPTGPRAGDLVHHNLFFTDDSLAEFGPIGAGNMPTAPTLYICAEDRAAGPAQGVERFEIIVNGPAGHPDDPDEERQCRTRTFDRLARMGLTFDPLPLPHTLTTPAMLGRLFPGSQGAIYGRSPEGLMAAFQRPGARTALPGLYLAGGGAHPGAGVPMAALSGQHAAEAILADRTLASTSAPTAMPGGMSMASRMTGRARSR